MKRITPSALRAEGVVEIGAALGTSVLFVLTRRGLHLFRSDALPDRTLDRYGVDLAVTWMGLGAHSEHVARDLGITEANLRRSLLAAGYQRLTSAQLEQRQYSRMRRGRGGNRRGRLVRIGAVS